MPPTAATFRVGRYFLALLAILVLLTGLVFFPGKGHTPKLGLDLEGGSQIIFLAQTDNGKPPTSASMKVAKQILTQRVNGTGVSNATVVQQGSDRIVVSVPGGLDKIKNVGQAAQLNFRPLVMPPFSAATSTVTTTTPTATATGSTTTKSTTTAKSTSTAKSTTTAKSTATSTAKGTSSANGIIQPRAAAPTTSGAGKATPASTATKTTTPKTTTPKTTTATGTPTATPTTSATSTEVQDPFTKLGFALPTSDTAYAALTTTQQTALTAALANFKCGSKPTDVATKDLAACATDGSGYKFLLGPVIIAGKQVTGASAVAPDVSGSGGNAEWTVSLDLNGAAQKIWANYTSAHHSNTTTADPATCSASTTPCAEFVGFTLDGDVISYPHNQDTINGQTTQISGSFTQSSATELADQLKFGALPLSFKTETTQTVSATLGSAQLKAGLLAGGIGLLLVVLYSLLYYRGLGLVTVSSLVVSGLLTYGSLVVLGREMGFTLTLSGIAGFIVAIGITADSFVVFFERLKDEVHEGRSIRVAVPRAWTRARRTILSADTVSFLAAAVLYYFTAGDVRGFAFTLGLSTLLDLVVVFLFTHPLVSLLSRSRAFGSPRFTGLNSVRRAGALTTEQQADTRDEPVRPTARAARRPAASSGVALLEPEIDEREVDEPEAVAVDPADAAPAAPSRSARRSRVSPRPVADAVVSEDAAERAAARRGRTVRPRPEPVVEPDEDEVTDDVTDETAADDVTDETAADDVTDDTAVDDVTDDTAPDELAGASDQDTVPEVEVETPAPSARTRARRPAAPAPVVPPAPVTPPASVTPPTPVTPPAPVTRPEPVTPPAPVTAPTAAVDTPHATAAPATAAERAAARRARIRAKAVESEDES